MDMSTEHADLVRRFSTDMTNGVAELARLGYPATIFVRMLADHGAVEATNRLVMEPKPSYGLWRLRELNRLDASVEMWVLLPWYEPLFDESVREQAERKLRLLDVDVDRERASTAVRFGQIVSSSTRSLICRCQPPGPHVAGSRAVGILPSTSGTTLPASGFVGPAGLQRVTERLSRSP
jgi:hypothetical protein